MSVSEAQRFEMHTVLRKVMGEEVADTMMEYMPPFGWADVARKSDIDRLDSRFDQVDKRFATVVGALWALGGIMATGFFGLGAAIFTKL